MNHRKFDELVERIERTIQDTKDLTIHEMAVAVGQALMPELDRPDWSPADSNALTQLGVLVKLGAEQHAELTRLVTRMQGSMEKLNALQVADKATLTKALERLDALELVGKVGASFPKDWTIASVVHHDSICHVCKSPKRACRCPTL
jgi:hypothetical protein